MQFNILYITLLVLTFFDALLFQHVPKFKRKTIKWYHRIIPFSGFYFYLKYRNAKPTPGYIYTFDGVQYVLQLISFLPEILEHTFSGVEYIGMDYKKEFSENTVLMQRVIECANNNRRFMPNLVEEMSSVIGEDSKKCYRGVKFMESGFCHSFYIKLSEYDKTIEKINHWKDYNEYNDLMVVIKHNID